MIRKVVLAIMSVVLAISLSVFAWELGRAQKVNAVSFNYNGHRWVRALHGGGLAHDPDCPCRANAERGAE